MFLTNLFIYPIKSFSAIELNESTIEERGLQFDRRWMLVDEKNIFLTQREYPLMSLFSIKLDESLSISYKNEKTISIPFKVSGENVNVQIWSSNCEALTFSESVNEWFSEILQTKCKLVFMNDESRRNINSKFIINNEIVSFADGYPLLITNEKSLQNLNDKLENKLEMNRFRPNLVVSGFEAFAEDSWKKIKIGNTVFRITKPCARCMIPTINQKTGEITGKEPLKTLATFRKAKDIFPDNYQEMDLTENAILFGQNLVAENFGEKICVGDKVEVLF